MFTPKYYELIEESQTRDAKAPVDYDFDLSELKGTWLSKLIQATLQSLWFQRLLRRCWPIARIGRLVVVSRYDDASEVLNNQDVFEAPFGREMSEMAGGTNFILGMRDDAAYQQMMRWIADAFRRDDVTKIIEPNSRKYASRVFEQSGGRIDVIRDLITGVPIKICKDYYGLDIRDEDGFAEWSIALSMLFFADPTGDPQTRRMARAAAEKLGVVIRNSIARARKQVDGDEAKSDTILGRLIAKSSEDPALSDDVICAILTGMITGFVPTNTLAAGNILEVLLERPQALAEARSAALADDDALLEHCLFEAMRFKPPLNPGVFRYATAQFTLAKGTRRAKTIKKGSTVIVATASAMHDAAKFTEPWKFSPDRSDEDDILFGKTGMLFGSGLHRCIGLEIARKQIMQTMKELLRQKSLRPVRGRAGRLQKIGPFPTRLVMEYGEIESPSPLAMITLCAEISDGVVDKIKCELDELGNPAGLALKKALDDTGCLHFASMSVIEGDTKKAVPNSLVLELTADGIESDVIDTIALAAGQPLRKIFKMAGLKDDEDLASFMRRHVLDVRPRFWTTVGLAFCGTPWLSVKRIRDEEALEKKVAAQLPGSDGKPLQLTLPRTVLDHIRMELKNDSRFAFAFIPAALPFRDRRKAPWNTASEPGFWGIIPDLVRKARVASGVICVALVVVTALIYWGLTKSPGPVAQFGWVAGSFAASLILIVSLILAIVTAAVVLAIISLSLKLKLNRLEEADQPRDRDPDPEQVDNIMKLENAPRVAQNHMTAVSTMKPGWLRSFALLGVFFIIEKLAAMEKFRPGFLSNIGTIHFARWVRLPGTNKLLFFSNYSGSWESYMEDFITMAHNGLTAVWSNTCNFPRAHNLFEDGATDGDHFKRWARGQQIPTRFWYSGYPHLTTERIRTNAMIRDGIARARSDSDAEAWLSLFHSVPRPATALEFDQIQTLAFGGMGKLEEASCILIKFGEDGGKVRAWLEETRNSLAFGETLPVRGIAQALALSASGLGACGLCTLASSSEKDALTSFPSAFLKGMADETRSKILGDVGAANQPSAWAWGNDDCPVDAVLLVYAVEKRDLDTTCENARRRLSDYGHSPFMTIRMRLTREAPPNGNLSREPFGFVDGISQPVIRGTRRYYKGVDEMHVVDAGELILGYPDGRGQFPATPRVYAADDPNNLLPSPPERLPQRYPMFDSRNQRDRAPRDLGRNGTFLVIRQLEQNVPEFNEFLARAAQQLNEKYDGENEIDAEWVAAKMVGRWRDGASLVRNPNPQKPKTGPDGKVTKRRIENDFWLGREDPQGYRCPFSAHIRRANPRDSFHPGSGEQLTITNRHRILRVGRPYVANEEDNEASGLLFMCLNANIERQFEFIQQTWVLAPSFHDLGYEVDPMVGSGSNEIFLQAGIQPPERQFWIPSPAGPMVVQGLRDFVRVRGGGYFFLPGRRALAFLSYPSRRN